MTQATLIAHCGTSKITRNELAVIPTPEATRTHQPLSHIQIVETIEEALRFRHLSIAREEYAVSPDGMKMFGVMDLLSGDPHGNEFRFSIGLRNSNDKSMRLALTAGLRVFCCDNMAFKGDFYPVLAKHSKSLSLRDVVTLGVDKIQRQFDPLAQQIESWKGWKLTDEAAKVFLYDTFITGFEGYDFPKTLLPKVHREYFEPTYSEFAPRTVWSLNNAFTCAFKEIEKPIRQFQLTAKLGDYFTRRWG